MFSRYKGYYEYAKSKGVDVGVPVGLDVLIDGTVPTGILVHHLHAVWDFDFNWIKVYLHIEVVVFFYRKIDSYIFILGSGLSSSAAFVCSSTIAIMAAFGVNFPKVCYLHFGNHKSNSEILISALLTERNCSSYMWLWTTHWNTVGWDGPGYSFC